MSAIRRKDQKSPVAHHFSEMSHSISELNFVVIEHIHQVMLTDLQDTMKNIYTERVHGNNLIIELNHNEWKKTILFKPSLVPFSHKRDKNF